MEILENISAHLHGVVGVIYCHRVTSTRLTGDDKLHLAVIKAMCGWWFFSRIVICSTHWDVSKRHESDRERMESLLNNRDQFGSIMEGGAMYMEFGGKEDRVSCQNILDLFLMQRCPLALAIMRQQQQQQSYQQPHQPSHPLHTKGTEVGQVGEEEQKRRQAIRDNDRSLQSHKGEPSKWEQYLHLECKGVGADLDFAESKKDESRKNRWLSLVGSKA